MLKEYGDMKEEIKNLKVSTAHQRFIYLWNNVILLFEVYKKYRKLKTKSCKTKKEE